jgi:hypothetical protein
MGRSFMIRSTSQYQQQQSQAQLIRIQSSNYLTSYNYFPDQATALQAANDAFGSNDSNGNHLVRPISQPVISVQPQVQIVPRYNSTPELGTMPPPLASDSFYNSSFFHPATTFPQPYQVSSIVSKSCTIE